MLASVLRSKRAIEVNIAIVRTFIRLRQMLATREELTRKVAQHDQEIAILFDHIQHLPDCRWPALARESGVTWDTRQGSTDRSRLV